MKKSKFKHHVGDFGQAAAVGSTETRHPDNLISLAEQWPTIAYFSGNLLIDEDIGDLERPG